MLTSVEQVREFHDIFQPKTASDVPNTLTIERTKLRISLIEEELTELAEALGKENRVEVLDALCDLQYVLDGTFVECGMADIKDLAFAEVHRSNMSKADDNWEDAKLTLEHYRNQGVICQINKIYIPVPAAGEQYKIRYTVLRDDGKVLKSLKYSAARLLPIIENKLFSNKE